MTTRTRFTLISFTAVLLLAGCAKKADDAQLTTNIKAQMFSDAQTKDANLQVAVKDGVVTLTGTVPSDAARYEAYKLASSTPGVTKVNDQMTVQAPAETANAAPAESPAAPAPAPEKARPSTHARHSRHRSAASKNSGTESQSASAANAEQTNAASAPTQSAPAAAPAPPPQPATETAIFPAGTTVEVQTVDPIDSKTGQAGDQFQATLAQPLTWNGRVVVPAGQNVYLKLVQSSQAGHYKGRSELQLALDRLEFQGQQHPLSSQVYTVQGSSRGKNTAEKVGGAAALGAIIGAIAGGGKGAAIGAGVGAAGGGVYQGATKGKAVRIAPETKLDFRLDQPLKITFTPGNSE